VAIIEKPLENRHFGPHVLWERERDPKFWTTIFKSGSHSNFWESLAEFRSVTSKGDIR